MFMSFMLRMTCTFAGVVTFHVPRGLESVQAAPGAGGVETAMSSDEPLMIDAQPESAVPRRATAISEPSLILCPLLVEQFGFTSSAVGCRNARNSPTARDDGPAALSARSPSVTTTPAFELAESPHRDEQFFPNVNFAGNRDG